MTRSRLSLTSIVAEFAVLLASMTGCSDVKPKRVPVAGTVTIDGAPLTFGSVMFINSNTRPAGSAIDSQGHFTLSCYEAADGAIIGHHRVKVTAAQPYGQNAVRWLAPKKYANENTSELEFEISEPVENLKINLTWAGKKSFIER